MNAVFRWTWKCRFAVAVLCLPAARTLADVQVYLTDVPDYEWHAGCFGTASGNLMGYWDRHGMSDFYTGPTGGGVAPLNSFGGNVGIRSLWASQAGLDGRPANSMGHINDYYVAYESTAADPYLVRTEHAPDCIGDFIGLSQNKWTNLNNECRGNIDAYSFVFWDKRGVRRTNYYQTNAPNIYVPDIQSGFKEWARYRGYDADVFTQLTDFNPERTAAGGFTYENLKAEINAGYPVLCFLQPTTEMSRNLPGMPNANPEIHGVMVYGYFTDSFSGVNQGVMIRTSWASGGSTLELTSWSAAAWLGLFPVRGVIGFHPKPKITAFTRAAGNITLRWDGPASQVRDEVAGTTTPVHRYQVQRATRLSPADWQAVTTLSTNRSVTIPDAGGPAFYRVVLSPSGL